MLNCVIFTCQYVSDKSRSYIGKPKENTVSRAFAFKQADHDIFQKHMAGWFYANNYIEADRVLVLWQSLHSMNWQLHSLTQKGF